MRKFKIDLSFIDIYLFLISNRYVSQVISVCQVVSPPPTPRQQGVLGRANAI